MRKNISRTSVGYYNSVVYYHSNGNVVVHSSFPYMNGDERIEIQLVGVEHFNKEHFFVLTYINGVLCLVYDCVDDDNAYRYYFNKLKKHYKFK